MAIKKEDKIRVGLIGYGYWGPNLLRNLVANPTATVVGVIEQDRDSRARCLSLNPGIPVFESLEVFLASQKTDAMVVATPPTTHCGLAVRCLEAGAHVLIEKPLATSTAECDKILATARKSDRLVMVDHTFAFHPAVQYLKSSIDRLEIGKLLYYDSVRVNLGGFQPKTNVLWDLAPHDLSILDVFLDGRSPIEVSASGMCHFGAKVEDLCYLTLKYPDSFIAHICLNWIAPVKIRTITLGGERKMAIYDDNNPTEKVKIYDRSVALNFRSEHDFRVNYRVGDMVAPAIPAHEALKGMVSHFLDCIVRRSSPVSDGAAGRRIIEVLEAATLSMTEGGRPVSVGKGPTERRKGTGQAAA